MYNWKLKFEKNPFTMDCSYMDNSLSLSQEKGKYLGTNLANILKISMLKTTNDDGENQSHK